MIRWRHRGWIVLFGLAFSSCSDPLSEQDKATLVRTLIEGTIDAGTYVVFWDGKDNQRRQVESGVYVCRFWARAFGASIEMTALPPDPRRPPRTNDSTVVDLNRIPLHFSLSENHPDPFYVNEGTNIPFEIPYPTEILLTIHRKE